MVYKMLADMRFKFPEYKKLCLSGGLFANVKLNQFINESNLYDEIYIHQAMGDSGLFLGAALLKAYELKEIKEPYVVLLIGLPLSGKDTFLKSLDIDNEDINNTYIHIINQFFIDL